MKISAAIATLIASFAPFAFATDNSPAKLAADIPAVDYHYGMKLDVDQVIYRSDNSDKTGVVPTIMVYRDTQGDLHKIRYLEWGGRSTDQG